MRATAARATGQAQKALSTSELMKRFDAMHQALGSKVSWPTFLGVAGAYMGTYLYFTNWRLMIFESDMKRSIEESGDEIHAALAQVETKITAEIRGVGDKIETEMAHLKKLISGQR